MSPDLALAMIFIAALTVLSYLAGSHLSSSRYKNRPLLLGTSLTFSIVFGWSMAGKLFWVNAIPGSAVLYWSNTMPLIAAFLAGIASSSTSIHRFRRPVAVATFMLIAAGYLLIPIVRPALAPIRADQNSSWQDNVCLQSHESTCGPAAAATLLKLNGIPATESQMIELCLTSSYGTEPLGLYRGLSVANGDSSKVQLASRNPNRWIGEQQLPNVSLVRFDGPRTTRNVSRFFGARGEGHAIVVLGRTDEGWMIADPAIGKVCWSDHEFNRRFTGDAIYLSK